MGSADLKDQGFVDPHMNVCSRCFQPPIAPHKLFVDAFSCGSFSWPLADCLLIVPGGLHAEKALSFFSHPGQDDKSYEPFIIFILVVILRSFAFVELNLY